MGTAGLVRNRLPGSGTSSCSRQLSGRHASDGPATATWSPTNTEYHMKCGELEGGKAGKRGQGENGGGGGARGRGRMYGWDVRGGTGADGTV